MLSPTLPVAAFCLSYKDRVQGVPLVDDEEQSFELGVNIYWKDTVSFHNRG